MVLETLVNLSEAIKHPAWVFLIGGLVSVISIIVSYFIFSSSIGWFSVVLTTIAMTPFMIKLTRYDEEREEELIKSKVDLNIFQKHKDVLRIYSVFFAGMILSLTLLYLVLPDQMSSKIFSDQVSKIKEIRGSASLPGSFQAIIVNNLGVLIISFLLSFLFGAGAILILAWNASVLATAIGISAKSLGGVQGLPMAILYFFPHGSLEIFAYFIGAIAGGLISAALTRKNSKFFMFIFKDSTKLLLFSIIILAVAGLIESFQIIG